MRRLLSPKLALLTFFLLCLLAVALSFLGPPEKSLGYAIRLVYLHTAWVWTALAGFAGAAFTGAAGLALRLAQPRLLILLLPSLAGNPRYPSARVRETQSHWQRAMASLTERADDLHRWSRAWGCVGLAFWLTYIPLTMLAAQANWNGLFLAEPRWRVAFEFAVIGVALQLAAALLEHPAWASAVNVFYLSALLISLDRAGRVMHPVSPIGGSGAFIQIFFALPLGVLLLAALQLARWWRARDLAPTPSAELAA